jgi:hypothetical protein
MGVWQAVWRIMSVEKLRKVLEKKAASFSRKQAEKWRVRQGRSEIFLSARNPEEISSKPAGPLTGGVENKQQLYSVFAHAVRNDIRSAGNHQLPSAGYAPGSA